MNHTNPAGQSIRTEKLGTLFRYRTMQEVESSQPSVQELPHRHDYFVIIYVEKAKGRHQVDFKTMPLEDQTVYFISPEQIHHLELNDSPKGHVLLFTPDFLQQHSVSAQVLFDMNLFFNCDEALPVFIPEKNRPEVLYFIKQIQKEQDNQGPQWLEVVGALLKTLLIYFQRIKKEHYETNELWDSRKSQIVRQFKKDLERLYKKKHKVSEYADLQHLSSVYLNEVIKGETGQSVKEFIQNRIVLEAKRLALYSDWSMKQIAWELGFEDAAHFSRLFKKCQGETFTQFRAKSVG
jgi:AraC family transcriptional activator of pobA